MLGQSQSMQRAGKVLGQEPVGRGQLPSPPSLVGEDAFSGHYDGSPIC